MIYNDNRLKSPEFNSREQKETGL